MQAVKIVLPVYFLAKFDTNWGGVNGSLNLRRLRNGWLRVIKRQNKTATARGKRDNDD